MTGYSCFIDDGPLRVEGSRGTQPMSWLSVSNIDQGQVPIVLHRIFSQELENSILSVISVL